MKLIFLSVTLILAVECQLGRAQQQPSSGGQPPPGAGTVLLPQPIMSQGGYLNNSTTAVEGALRGAGALIQAEGEYNYNTAAGLVNAEEAATKDITNRAAAVDNYFTLKRVNAGFQALSRGPHTPQEELVRLSKITAPKRLTSFQLDPATGVLNWPAALRRPEFEVHRKRLDDLFAERESGNCGLGTENYDEIVYLTNLLQQELKSDIANMTPAEYLSARKFLTSIDYEARFVPSVESAAVR